MHREVGVDCNRGCFEKQSENLRDSFYFSSSNSAFTFAAPPETVSLRSQALKPFLVILTVCSPAGRVSEEGVLPINLPSTSTSADGGADEMETAARAPALLVGVKTTCGCSVSWNLALAKGMFPIT